MQQINLEKAYHAFRERGGQVIARFDLNWPVGMNRFSKEPKELFLEGDVDIFQQHPAVAIVGSRQANEEGLSQAYEVADALCKEGCIIISGGALGIDSSAHEGAIAAGGKTLAVLPNPLSLTGKLIPSRLAHLGNKYFHAVSFYGPSIAVAKTLFVARNQYIAALSDAVIVMQGLSKSGALYTAQAAKRFKIPLFATPGALKNPLYEAPNSLLAEGSARAFISTEQFLDAILGKKRQKIAMGNPKTPALEDRADLLPQVQAGVCHPILDFLHKNEMRSTFDEIAHALHLPGSELQLKLLELELEGYLKKEGPFIICLS